MKSRRILRNNVKLCTVCDGTVNIHHAGIKTKGSICSYPALRIYAIISLEPVTESSNISIFQHTALWHTCEPEVYRRINRSCN